MDTSRLEKKLLDAARATSPSDAVPYAFEKRIMARLGSPENPWLLWGRALWRGAMGSLCVAVLCSAWASFNPNPSSFDLSQDLEHTITASADEVDTGW